MEGKELSTKQLFDKIYNDSRHSDVTLLMTGALEQRLFMNWYMGFHRLDRSSLLNASGVKKSKHNMFDYYTNHPEMSSILFEAIAAQVA